MATTTLPYTPPLQELPPWLSYSTFITTVGQTAVVTQTVVNLPLTYYGPPIPLGTDGVWVYGGLTSPPPTPTATSSSASAPTSSSASASSSSSASSPSSSSASVTASPSTPFSGTTPSSTAPSTPTASAHDHSGFPVWAILVIAIVCGLAVGIGLLLAFALWYRRRHPSGSSSSSSHYPDDDEVEQGGTRFRILRALPIPRSLRSSQHRHSRVPQHDEETAQVMVIHPNDSDWQLVGQSREQLAAIRNVRPPPGGSGAAYGPILPFDDRTPPHTPPPSQPSSSTSSQPGTTLPRPDTMGGNSFSDMSNHSLFFNPALQAGETFDRDRRVFPDHYALGIEQSPQFQPLNPPPRPRALPPVDQDLVLPPPLIGGARRSGEGRRSGDRARSQAAPLMAYPDSPVSDADEAAALLAARRRSASPPTRTSTPPITDNNRLISRLSTLIKRLSGSSQAATTTPFMLHPSTPTTAGPATSSRQQMKETGAGLGFGFLAAPPVSMSTRRTGATTSDRPISTISGATVYHDAHSRPQSPYHDAPPTYQPSHTPTPERAYDEVLLPEEADILDEQPPRPLHYPPGLTPPQVAYQQRRGSTAGVGETGLLEELEEEDIVGELPPHPLDDLDDDAPEAGQEFAALSSSSSKGKEREKRGTLGAPMPFAGTQTPSAKSPTSSHFPHRSASRSTGGHSGSGSGTSSSRRSRRTGGSSVSSSSLRRLQQSSGSGDAYLVPPDEMPTAGKGKRRGGNPLLSATFGPPATWLRSRSPSAGSTPPTPRSGRSVKSHSHSKSKSRSGSQPHSQEPSRGPSPAPPPPELRTVASFAESAFSLQQSMTTAVTTEPSASVRYVPSRQRVRVEDKAELTAEEEERLPLTSA